MAGKIKGSALLALAAALLLGAVAINAQAQLTLQFRDTGVTLDARNVPVRQILDEWARIGGTRIVNGDKVLGAAVTLQLIDVPERQALDIVLRSVSGYMLAMRQPGTPGASAVDRILILPTSTPPRNPPPVSAASAAVNRQLPRQPVQPPVVDPDANPDDQPEEEPSEASTAVPTLIEAGATRPGAVAPPQAGQPVKPLTTTPGNPFGRPRGSGAPGVVTPVPPSNPFGPVTSAGEGQGQTPEPDGAR